MEVEGIRHAAVVGELQLWRAAWGRLSPFATCLAFSNPITHNTGVISGMTGVVSGMYDTKHDMLCMSFQREAFRPL